MASAQGPKWAYLSQLITRRERWDIPKLVLPTIQQRERCQATESTRKHLDRIAAHVQQRQARQSPERLREPHEPPAAVVRSRELHQATELAERVRQSPQRVVVELESFQRHEVAERIRDRRQPVVLEARSAGQGREQRRDHARSEDGRPCPGIEACPLCGCHFVHCRWAVSYWVPGD